MTNGKYMSVTTVVKAKVSGRPICVCPSLFQSEAIVLQSCINQSGIWLHLMEIHPATFKCTFTK